MLRLLVSCFFLAASVHTTFAQATPRVELGTFISQYAGSDYFEGINSRTQVGYYGGIGLTVPIGEQWLFDGTFHYANRTHPFKQFGLPTYTQHLLLGLQGGYRLTSDWQVRGGVRFNRVLDFWIAPHDIRLLQTGLTVGLAYTAGPIDFLVNYGHDVTGLFSETYLAASNQNQYRLRSLQFGVSYRFEE